MTASATLPSHPLTTVSRATGDGPQPPVIRCSDTADFLAALPFLTGFTAENSLFIVFFHGKRSDGAMRVDLPPHRAPELTAALVDGLCEILRDTGAGAAGPALVITSEQGFAETHGAPWKGLARLLRRRFAREDWPLRELAVVAPDGWACMLGDRAGERRPLAESRASPVAGEAAAAAPPPTSLDALGRLPEPDPARTAEIAACLAELDRRERSRRGRPVAAGRGPAAATVLHGAAWIAGACFAAGDRLPEPRLVARLIRAAEDPDRWLALALTALTRAEFIVDAVGEGEADRLIGLPLAPSGSARPDPAPDRSVQGLLSSLSYDRPEPEKLRRVAAVLGDAIAHAPEARRPGLLALLAWAWWMIGLQTVSQRFIAQALEIDPEHRLTLMVGRLNQAPPPWQLLDLRDGRR